MQWHSRLYPRAGCTGLLLGEASELWMCDVRLNQAAWFGGCDVMCVQCGVVWCSVVCVVWCDVMWCGVVWCAVLWYLAGGRQRP